jgi:hypothetical protein
MHYISALQDLLLFIGAKLARFQSIMLQTDIAS